MKTEYWTTFGGTGAYERICSRHRTPEAAVSAASKCEKSGGVYHRVYKVERVKRRKVKS